MWSGVAPRTTMLNQITSSKKTSIFAVTNVVGMERGPARPPAFGSTAIRHHQALLLEQLCLTKSPAPCFEMASDYFDRVTFITSPPHLAVCLPSSIFFLF